MNMKSKKLDPRPKLPNDYPRFRYMGSKYKLLPWIEKSLKKLDFTTVLDAFSGSGAVSYLFKTLGKQVFSNDFLHFDYLISKATTENSESYIDETDLSILLDNNSNSPSFIQDTFGGIFYTEEELKFLDQVSFNLSKLQDPNKKALTMAALVRSCLKKQPRGVFTVATSEKYNDGRRDLQLSLQEHFLEQVEVFNEVVFDNGQKCKSFNLDVFDEELTNLKPDLVYMDPPYVPRSDDNCYVKRYHFLEGLSNYWRDMEILESSKVKKLKKKYTPFSYRKTAVEAFDTMFSNFKDSILVLSYSSNGYPDLKDLKALMKKYKSKVTVKKKEHRYHFGTHDKVSRAVVDEYLIIGT